METHGISDWETHINGNDDIMETNIHYLGINENSLMMKIL